jgi:hypothetical protein
MVPEPMMGFVFRLIPPRPSFASDMSPQERATMLEHVAYWTQLAAAGQALAFGPVDDPADPHGIGIVLAAGQAEAEELRDGDRAMRSPHCFKTEIHPMRWLVTPTGT